MFNSVTILLLVCNVSAWSGFAVLIFFDPHFYLARDLLLVDLRIRPRCPFGTHGFHALHRLGWRILLMVVLVSLCCLSVVSLLIRQLLDRNQPAVFVIACWGIAVLPWLFVFGFHRLLYNIGFMRRARSLVPIATQLATELHAKWPTSGGAMPWIGRFSVYPEAPHRLILGEGPSRFPLSESCGSVIRHDPDGIVRFDLASRCDINMALEIFLNDGQPHSFEDASSDLSISRKLVGSARLAERAWLAWYELELADMTEKGAESLSNIMVMMANEIAKHGHDTCCTSRDGCGM